MLILHIWIISTEVRFVETAHAVCRNRTCCFPKPHMLFFETAHAVFRKRTCGFRFPLMRFIEIVCAV
jgi:hypothetical protein